MNNYHKLLIMLAVSFIVMYVVMFLNIVDLGHIYLSMTRIYMALLMVCPMALMMLFLMGRMYGNKKLNSAIIVVAVVVFIIALTFLRTQTFVDDSQYMKAMIPHHSSAIMTSENADIEDAEVKELAEQIIITQKEEIKIMKELLNQ